MKDYSHIPVNVILVKKKAQSRPTFNFERIDGQLNVGDYVTGNDGYTPYSYTTKDCVARVDYISMSGKEMQITLVAHRTRGSFIGRDFVVSTEYFHKIDYMP